LQIIAARLIDLLAQVLIQIARKDSLAKRVGMIQPDFRYANARNPLGLEMGFLFGR